MSSLRQLLAAHAPLLLLDTASTHVQVGWLRADGSSDWRKSSEEAGVGIFESLERLGVQSTEAEAFLYCEGPGSVLGIRTAAMAMRTWTALRPRPVYGYFSLALVAHQLRRPDLTVIADARREAWHSFNLQRGLVRVPTAELGGELVTPENFRAWSVPPPNVTAVPYSLDRLLPELLDDDLFRTSAEPDAFLHEDPSYAKWTPQIHRAPEK